MNADKKILIIFLLMLIGLSAIIKCPYKLLTGEPCLFCGTLTSLTYLIRGKIKDAWITNPIGVVVFFWLLFLFGKAIYERF